MAAKRNFLPARSKGIETLFRRVVAILDQARESVVQSVNSQMVLAYWHIGREIVQTLQRGDERAEYGRRLVADLSERLTGRFGRGFSTTNLWYFRQFYLAYADRRPEIVHKPGGESAQAGKLHKARGELPSTHAVRPKPDRVLGDLSLAIEHPERIEGFSPRLSWSHYRALTKVQARPERLFYDQFTTEGDNPTIGLVLCAEKNEAVAKYSVLAEGRQIFAARYVKYLPTEMELRRELERERRLIESRRAATGKRKE